MNIDAQRKEVERKRKEAEEAKEELALTEKQANCNHNWGEPERVYVEPKAVGYHIPKVKVYKWKRICDKCKQEETTEDYEEKVIRIPKF